MPNRCAFRRAWFGGSDIHAPVKLAAVGRQNLRAELLRQPNCQRCFASRRGASDDD
jgi:hypothetical protein